MKLLRYLANLGYGSRREVLAMFADGRVTDVDGELLYGDDVRAHDTVRLDGAPLRASVLRRWFGQLKQVLDVCSGAIRQVVDVAFRALSPGAAGADWCER